MFDVDLDGRIARPHYRSEIYADDGRLRAETTDRELLTRSNSWRYTTRHIVNAQKKRAVMPERWA